MLLYWCLREFVVDVTLLVPSQVCIGCYFIGPFASLQWVLLYWSLREFVVDVTLLVPSRICSGCYFIGPSRVCNGYYFIGPFMSL